MSSSLEPGVLVLEGVDGSFQEFNGRWVTEPVDPDQILSNSRRDVDLAFGEVVFNTSMSGYQESLSDPSYCGQILCFTLPHIGNVGANPNDYESPSPYLAGCLISELSDYTSSWRSEESLLSFLKRHKIPTLCDVSTRALTISIRSGRARRGVLLRESDRKRGPELLRALPTFEGRDLTARVTTQKKYRFDSSQNSNRRKIAAIDFGCKTQLLKELTKRGADVWVFPAHTTAEEIDDFKPDGIFLSNGPGDPNLATAAISTTQKLLGRYPLFGVCMGHQILSLALGAEAYKLPFGHRGANQPVFDLEQRRVLITSQNHGFAIREESYSSGVRVTHINLNDKSVEGISVPDLRAFSVQYHPEASPGPHDSAYLFDQFLEKLD